MLKRLAFDNLVLVAQYAVNGLVPLLLIPHIVRTLGLDAYGSLAIALAWANYGSVIVQYAFQYTGPQRLAQLRSGETEKTVVCRVASAKLVLLVAVLATAVMISLAAKLRGVPLSSAQFAVLVILPLAATLHTGWHLQAVGRFVTVGTASVVGALGALAVGFGLVQAGRAYVLMAAALALIIGPLIAGIGTLLASVTRLAAREPRAGWRTPWSELRTGWPLFASQFTAALYGASGPIIVGVLAGVAQAGAYSAVERITNAIAAACILTHTAAYPKLARFYVTDQKAYLRLLLVVIGAYLAIAAGVAVTVLAFWQPTLHFLFGSQWAGHGTLVAAALGWLLLVPFGTVFTGYLTVSGNGKAVLPLTLRILALSLCLGIPGVVFFGAWAWMASLAASQLLVLAAARRAWTMEARRPTGMRT